MGVSLIQGSGSDDHKGLGRFRLPDLQNVNALRAAAAARMLNVRSTTED
jgi:hypothetical protein